MPQFKAIKYYTIKSLEYQGFATRCINQRHRLDEVPRKAEPGAENFPLLGAGDLNLRDIGNIADNVNNFTENHHRRKPPRRSWE
jgi:hypothetical protein